jgi:transposase
MRRGGKKSGVFAVHELAVRALMAMKGFQTAAAMIVVSELGTLDRFTHPQQVMAYLGLVPSEKSSGDRRRQGADHQVRQRACALFAGGVRPALRRCPKSPRN